MSWIPFVLEAQQKRRRDRLLPAVSGPLEGHEDMTENWRNGVLTTPRVAVAYVTAPNKEVVVVHQTHELRICQSRPTQIGR